MVTDGLRKKLAQMYARAYPDATLNDAKDWRLRTVGKMDTTSWDFSDYERAIEKLRVKLGIPARPKLPDLANQGDLFD